MFFFSFDVLFFIAKFSTEYTHKLKAKDPENGIRIKKDLLLSETSVIREGSLK